MSKRFAVVHFSMTNDVAVVPLNWMNGGKCTWPPFKSHGKVMEATKNRMEPDATWSEFSARIIQSYDTYEGARKHLRRAEDTSDLNTESEDIGRGKRAKKARRMSSSLSDDSSEDDTSRVHKKCSNGRSIDDLPRPPAESPLAKGCNNGSIPTSSLAFEISSPSPAEKENESFLQRLPTKGPKTLEASEIDFRRQVLRELAVLRATVNQNRDSIQAILDVVCNQQTSSNSVDESATTPIPGNLPLQSMEDLEELEGALVDETVKNSMVTYFSRIGGINLADVTKRILARLMSDGLAAQFSWVGAKKKKPLSNLVLADVILKAVRRNSLFKEASERDVELAIKNWLRHAPERFNGKKKQGQENNQLQ